MKTDLPAIVRAELEKLADAKNAGPMQAYMKSTMPFLGIKSGPRRATLKRIFTEHPLPDSASWKRAVLALWRQARFREERYAAIELTGHRLYRAHQTLEALPMYEEMIVSGAWWDLVDELASDRVGPLLEMYPKEMGATLRRWSRDADLWKRRTSIIAQLRFKKDTDLELLYACIEPSLDSKEFFLRKAIGWALRQYAWTDPKEIARYVKVNAKRLSGLSRREALKNIATRRSN